MQKLKIEYEEIQNVKLCDAKVKKYCSTNITPQIGLQFWNTQNKMQKIKSTFNNG